MKRSYIIFYLFLILGGLPLGVFAQGGIDCASAVNILAGINTSNQGSTQYFKYKALKTGVATIAACDAPVDFTVNVSQGCSVDVDTFTSACVSGGKRAVSFTVIGGQTYVIQLTATGNNSQTFNWTLSIREAVNGETCDRALDTELGINTYNATGAMPVWYKITATTDSRIQINTCGHDYPYTLTAFASCNPADALETFHNNCVGSVKDRDNAFFYAKQGQTYYIRWKNPMGGAPVSFDFDLKEIPLGLGESCSNAKTLNVGTDSTGNAFVRWYKYNTSGNSPEKIVIQSCGSNSFYSQIRFSCGENDFERSVKHGTCGNSTTTQFEALPGTTYYVKVYPSANDTFGVYKSVPVTGESCANPFVAVLNTNHADHNLNTDQWYVYTPSVAGTVSVHKANWGNTQIRFYHNCSDAAFAINDTATEVAANESLYILLRNAGFIAYDWDLKFVPVTPGSDRISALNAVELQNDLSTPSKSIWYKFTPDVDADVHISTCGTASTSTYVQVQDKFGKYLGSSSGVCDDRSDLTVTVEGGQTIYMNWKSTDSIVTFDLDSTVLKTPIPAGYNCNHPLVPHSGENDDAYESNQPWQWYTYTALEAGTLLVENCSAVPSIFTKVYIQSSCGEFDRNTIATGTACGTKGSGTSVKLAQGQQVYIVWLHTVPDAGSFAWNLNFVKDADLTQGYSCSNALQALASNIGNTLQGDQFYTYTPSANGSLTISSADTTNLYVSVYTSCDFYNPMDPVLDAPIASGKVGGSGNAVVKFDCSKDNTYIIVWKMGYTNADFSWSLANVPLNNAASILSYGFVNQVGQSVFDNPHMAISAVMPNGTSLTSLKATYSASEGSIVRVGNVTQQSGFTINTFSNPVSYVVTAEDGITNKTWTVTVDNAKSNQAKLLSFSIANQVSTEFDTASRHVLVVMPAGTDITKLKPSFGISTGATIKIGSEIQESGVTLNNYATDVVYTIVAEDGVTSIDWTVSVSIFESINTGTISQIKVFPLPSTGLLNIDIPEGFGGNWNIQLENMLGEAVYESTFNGIGLIQLHLDRFDSGVYNLLLTQGAGRHVFRVIINK